MSTSKKPEVSGFSVVSKVKEYWLPILLTIGLLLLAIYYIYRIGYPTIFETYKDFFKELFGIALMICGSGIFLAVLKWFQFMDFFKREVERMFNNTEFDAKLEKTVYSVVYSEEFLKQRKDMVGLWSKMNKVLFNNQFSDELALQIQKKMHDLFIDNKELSHFYRRFIYTMNMVMEDDGFITLDVQIEAKIIRMDEKPFTYTLNYNITKMDENDQKSALTFNSIFIDSKPVDLTKIDDKDSKPNVIVKKFETQLDGRKEYELRASITMVYNLDTDCVFALFFERFIDYLRVDVTHTDNLKVHFLPFGNEVFEHTPKSNGFVKVYTPLIFPEKGFRLIFVKSKK